MNLLAFSKSSDSPMVDPLEDGQFYAPRHYAHSWLSAIASESLANTATVEAINILNEAKRIFDVNTNDAELSLNKEAVNHGIWNSAANALNCYVAILIMEGRNMVKNEGQTERAVAFREEVKKTSTLVEICDKISTLIKEEFQRQTAEQDIRFVLRYDGSTNLRELHTWFELEEAFIVNCLYVSTQQSYNAYMFPRRRGYGGGLESSTERFLRPIVAAGYVVILLGQLVLMCAKLEATVGRFREKREALRSNYKEWTTENRKIYDNLAHWVEGWRGTVDYHDAKLGMVHQGALMRGCMVITSNHDWTRTETIATTESAKYFIVGEDLSKAISKLDGIRYDAAGGRISASAKSLIATWAYIVVVLLVAIAACAFNWGSREAIFERLGDAVWIATTGLVSVFGLVKLTSEDPNAIKHALTGRKILTNPREVFLHLNLRQVPAGIGWVDALKALIATFPGDNEWVHKLETCYVKNGKNGQMLLTGGADCRVLAAAGVLVKDVGIIRPHWLDGGVYTVEKGVDRTLHVTDRPSEKKIPSRLLKGVCKGEEAAGRAPVQT